MHVCCFDGGEISRSRQHRRCIFPRGLSHCVLVPLQRPVQWTMVAVIAHVMIQWQEYAAAVLLASLCSRTARPAKVKHRHSNCSCHHINPPPVVLPGTLELLPPPGAHENYCQAIYTVRTLPVRTISYLRVGFFFFLLRFVDYTIIVLHPHVSILTGATNLTRLSAFQLHILSIILSFHQLFFFFVFLTVFPLHYHHRPFWVLAEASSIQATWVLRQVVIVCLIT